VPTFDNRGCHVVSVTVPHSWISRLVWAVCIPSKISYVSEKHTASTCKVKVPDLSGLLQTTWRYNPECHCLRSILRNSCPTRNSTVLDSFRNNLVSASVMGSHTRCSEFITAPGYTPRRPSRSPCSLPPVCTRNFN
jgi:hypothetical protein